MTRDEKRAARIGEVFDLLERYTGIPIANRERAIAAVIDSHRRARRLGELDELLGLAHVKRNAARSFAALLEVVGAPR